MMAYLSGSCDVFWTPRDHGQPHVVDQVGSELHGVPAAKVSEGVDDVQNSRGCLVEHDIAEGLQDVLWVVVRELDDVALRVVGLEQGEIRQGAPGLSHDPVHDIGVVSLEFDVSDDMERNDVWVALRVNFR